MPTVYHRNYQKLLQLIPRLADLQEGHYLRFEAGEAFMPLSVNVLERDRPGKRLCISLAHNFKMNGDLVPDPDMELLVDFERQRVEALTFQDQRVYQVVYPEPGAVYPALKRSPQLVSLDLADQPRPPGIPTHPGERRGLSSRRGIPAHRESNRRARSILLARLDRHSSATLPPGG